MLINLLHIFTLLKLLIPILSQVQTETLCQTGKNGVAVTSFQKNLYLLSSSFSYKIINQNYQNIISNNNNNPQIKPRMEKMKSPTFSKYTTKVYLSSIKLLWIWKKKDQQTRKIERAKRP